MAVGLARFKGKVSEVKVTVKLGEIEVLENVRKAIDKLKEKYKIATDKETVEVMLEEYVYNSVKKSTVATSIKNAQKKVLQGTVAPAVKPVKGLSKD